MSKKKITKLSPGLALVKMKSGETKVVDTVKAEFLVSKKLATIVDVTEGEEESRTATSRPGRTASRTKAVTDKSRSK